MKEYTIKPAYLYAEGWKKYEAGFYCEQEHAKKKAAANLNVTCLVVRFLGKLLFIHRSKLAPTAIVYASVTGNARSYAARLHSLLSKYASVSLVSTDDVKSGEDFTKFKQVVFKARSVIFLSSTYGNGELPASADKLIKRLLEDQNRALFEAKKVAILGFGSSAYPVFCGAADRIDQALVSSLGAIKLVETGKCDNINNELRTFNLWAMSLVQSLARETEYRNSAELTAMGFQEMSREVIEVGVSINFVDREKIAKVAAGIIVDGLGFGSPDSRVVFSKPLQTPNKSDPVWSLSGSELSIVEDVDLSTAAEIVDSTPPHKYRPCVIEDGAEKNVVSKAIGKKLSSVKTQGTWMLGRITSIRSLFAGHGPLALDDTSTRMTSLVSIDTAPSGSPPYSPGDHLMVLPQTVVSHERLVAFLAHAGVEVQ